jgi:alkanesulfonate monooxygenase SsuD/methylene tetrahydromethanopterin reductase-like flavin-dependent oxidoreductase (luciferase family)
MKFGTGFPLIALSDPGATRDFAQTYDGAGLDYITAAGHLLATTPERYEGRPQATYVGPFHDPFVLFAYLSAVTTHLHFVTSILILPLYETAVVAKQGAELAFVSGGRFELGVGISWQEAEYTAVGQDVHRRGARFSEQAEVLKLYWTKPFFSFKGKFHDIVPLWFGSTLDEKPMRRAAKFGDGWMPMGDPTEALPRFQQYMADAGRGGGMQLMTRLSAGEGGPDAWIAEGKRLQGIGATHITIGTPPDVTGAAATQRIIEARNALAGALT